MSSVNAHRIVLWRAAAGAVAVAALCLGMVGCRPEPAPSASPPPSSSTSPSPSTSASPTETAQAGEDIALPTACEQLSSPAMLASLQERGPLNDPGVTMTSTQNVGALEILTSGIPTIRCTWGAPGDTGLATNVSIVDEAQSAAVRDALIGAGFACEPIEGGTVCRSEQTMVDLDDDLVELTETHVLRGNAWVSTATINFEVEGYSEDIIVTLWG
ncbi:MAG: hypothetical protein ABWZ16_02800 [Microbacterium sp.]